jgi:hypothetical protein
VQFEYGEKSVKKKHYISGYKFEDFYLLEDIRVMSDNLQLRKYDFTYQPKNDDYQLTAINLTGENSEKIPQTTIAWGDDNTVIVIVIVIQVRLLRVLL